MVKKGKLWETEEQAAGEGEQGLYKWGQVIYTGAKRCDAILSKVKYVFHIINKKMMLTV